MTVYAVSDAFTAYGILMEKTIDIFLVDIILDPTKPGDTSGIQLVGKIRNMIKYMFTPVIFVTSLEDTTKYAFTDLNCLGYVEKPFSQDRVKQLVRKALYFPSGGETEPAFCFRKNGVFYPVRVREVLYIENTRHVVTVHLVNGSRLTVPYQSCQRLLDEVDANCLFQCSRSTIVNKDYVLNVDIQNRYITLKNYDDKIEIGVTFRKKVLAEYGL